LIEEGLNQCMLRPVNAGSFAKCRGGGRIGMIGRGKFVFVSNVQEMEGMRKEIGMCPLLSYVS
jgi:hypothetical protein